MAEEKKTSAKAPKAEKAQKPEKKSEKSKSKTNPFKSIAKFFKSVKSEAKKVVWPTAKDVIRNTGIVILVTAVVGVAIYAVDFGLTEGVKALKGLKENTTVEETTTEQTTAEALEEATEADTDAE